MKFTAPLNQFKPLPKHDTRSSAASDSVTDEGIDQGALFSVEGESVDGFAYGPGPAFDDEASARFQLRLQSGKVKICPTCGEVMSRATRMILSPVAGILLLILGLSVMAGYGLVINFVQTPWYLKFFCPRPITGDLSSWAWE